MHLHRQLVFGENEFHEQRKIALAVDRSAGPFGRHFRPRFAELSAGERALRETCIRCRSSRPRRSARRGLTFSGKSGARESEPHGRGLKTGSSRAGERFTVPWPEEFEEAIDAPQALLRCARATLRRKCAGSPARRTLHPAPRPRARVREAAWPRRCRSACPRSGAPKCSGTRRTRLPERCR